MNMKITSLPSGGPAIEHFNGSPPREVVLGEAVELRATGARITSIDVRTMPVGDPPAIDGSTITPRAVGIHHFIVESSDGERCDVRFVVCEPACIEWLATHVNSHSSPGSRKIMASLAAHAPWFTGRATELPGKALAPFGG